MRFRLPWRKEQTPTTEVFEVAEDVPELPDPEPHKGLTHILEWVPMGWATLEVDRGDGSGWDQLSSALAHVINARYLIAQEGLQDTLVRIQQEQDAQEEGSPVWISRGAAFDHFSKIEYRVRMWEEQTHWLQHSVGMERPLRRIMATLVKQGIPEDRVLVRKLWEE